MSFSKILKTLITVFSSAPFLKTIGELKKYIIKERLRFFLLAIIVVLFLIWKAETELVVFFSVFLTFFLFGWGSEIVVIFALFFLATCPFFIVYKKDLLAEQFALYAYYSLVIVAILQFKEIYGEEKRSKVGRKRKLKTDF